jgi:hypothetical protein
VVNEGLRAIRHQLVKARRRQPAPVPRFAVSAGLGENARELRSEIRGILACHDTFSSLAFVPCEMRLYQPISPQTLPTLRSAKITFLLCCMGE